MLVVRKGNVYIYILIVLIGLFVLFNVNSKKEQALKFTPLLEEEFNALSMPDGSSLIAFEKDTKVSAAIYGVYNLNWYLKRDDIEKIKSHFYKVVEESGWKFHSESDYKDNSYYEEWFATWYKGELELDEK